MVDNVYRLILHVLELCHWSSANLSVGAAKALLNQFSNHLPRGAMLSRESKSCIQVRYVLKRAWEYFQRSALRSGTYSYLLLTQLVLVCTQSCQYRKVKLSDVGVILILGQAARHPHTCLAPRYLPMLGSRQCATVLQNVNFFANCSIL